MLVAELLKCIPTYFSRMFWLWSKVKGMFSGEVVFWFFDLCCSCIFPTLGKIVSRQMTGVTVTAMEPFPMA